MDELLISLLSKGISVHFRQHAYTQTIYVVLQYDGELEGIGVLTDSFSLRKMDIEYTKRQTALQDYLQRYSDSLLAAIEIRKRDYGTHRP